MTSEIQWKQSRTKCFQLSDLERDDVKWDISWYPAWSLNRNNKSIHMLGAKNTIYCKGIMLETWGVGLGAGENGWRCLQAGILWKVNLRVSQSLESTLIRSIKMKWKWPFFSLWCHFKMNYRLNESAEVKLIEELNSPLIYYRLSIGIVILRPRCSFLAFDRILMLISLFFLCVYFVGFSCCCFIVQQFSLPGLLIINYALG